MRHHWRLPARHCSFRAGYRIGRLGIGSECACDDREAVGFTGRSEGAAILTSRAKRERDLSLDDVVNLQYFRLAWVDPHLGQDRAQALSKCVELLPRVPDLADLEVAVRAKAKRIVESVCRKHTSLRQSTDDCFVLLCGQRRRRVPVYYAQVTPPCWGPAT